MDKTINELLNAFNFTNITRISLIFLATLGAPLLSIFYLSLIFSYMYDWGFAAQIKALLGMHGFMWFLIVWNNWLISRVNK